jgi:hypothetical protein
LPKIRAKRIKMAGLGKIYIGIVVFGRNHGNQAGADLPAAPSRQIRDAAMRIRFCGSK